MMKRNIFAIKAFILCSQQLVIVLKKQEWSLGEAAGPFLVEHPGHYPVPPWIAWCPGDGFCRVKLETEI